MGPELPIPTERAYLTNSYLRRAIFIRFHFGGVFSWKFEENLHILAFYSLRSQALMYLVVEMPSFS